ncbi:nosL-related protein [hydrothermal vent metagenome]|uniref:NosL-related protein n=1 Tax=hydrothermal vent metagenome TaxID=652676 RepID=A0A1W1C6E3_9ZZZZ
MKRLLAVFIISTICLVAENNIDKPFKVKEVYTLNYDKNTTSLVRHLKVYKNPKWVAKIKTRDNQEVYFCSPKSMFEFYHRPAKWSSVGIKSEKDFAQIVVTDYLTNKAIGARDAYFIYGSNIISPAGDDLVAVETKEKADMFSKKYNGKRIFKFNEVPDALIKLLNGRI